MCVSAEEGREGERVTVTLLQPLAIVVHFLQGINWLQQYSSSRENSLVSEQAVEGRELEEEQREESCFVRRTGDLRIE